MGGLVVNPNLPAPWYEFEMLNATTGGLYLHFKVSTIALANNSAEWRGIFWA